MFSNFFCKVSKNIKVLKLIDKFGGQKKEEKNTVADLHSAFALDDINTLQHSQIANIKMHVVRRKKTSEKA